MRRVKSTERVADTQLNIRVDYLTSKAFRNFCTKHQVTQNEAMKMLLQNAGQEFYEKTDPLMKRLQQQDERISALLKINEELKHTHAEQHRRYIKQREDWVGVTDQLLRQIMDGSERTDEDYLPLEPHSFKYAKQHLNFKSYTYPYSAGCCIITIDHLVFSIGINSAIFVCGQTEAGELIKLRWYPKKGYLGFSPRAERFVYQDAPWIVGFLEAADKAMDLVIGVPLESIRYKLLPKYADAYEMIQKEGLDAITARAEHAKGGLDGYDLN